MWLNDDRNERIFLNRSPCNGVLGYTFMCSPPLNLFIKSDRKGDRGL